MAEKKKTRKKSASATELTQRKAQKSAVQANSGKREIASILLFAFAVFTLFLIIIKGQSVWQWLHNLVYGLFGVVVFALPVTLGVIAVFLSMDRLKFSAKAKIIESSLLFVLVAAAVDIFTADEGEAFGQRLVSAFNDGIELSSGGFVGALIGTPIRLACGVPGAAVIVFIAVFVLLMLITGTTLSGFFKLLSKPVKAVEKQAEDITAEKAKRAEERKKFNINVSVDDIPESRNKDEEPKFFENKGQKLIETYNFDNEPDIADDKKPSKAKKMFGGKEKATQLSLNDENVAADTNDATEISADENAVQTVGPIDGETVNVKEETNAFTKEVMHYFSLMQEHMARARENI